MANALLDKRWEEFIAKPKASAVVQEVREECERKERRRGLNENLKLSATRKSAADAGFCCTNVMHTIPQLAGAHQ